LASKLNKGSEYDFFLIAESLQNTRSKTSIAQVDNGEENAIQTLKEFYTAYISACDSPGSSKAMDSIRKKYLTKALLNKLEDPELELDYDPILQAQDCDKGTIQTLEIEPETGQRNVYNVCYTWPSANQITCIKLLLTEDGETYLIDDILSDTNVHGEL
jgi:hypothetical protein